MKPNSAVDVVSARRGLLVGFMAGLGLAFNYGTTVTTAADGVLFVAVAVAIGYPVLTLCSLCTGLF
ncbi:hypothetical protein [Natrinema altunense]|uniref:Uncharacterized protein n=2 Tax=Natrinema altunense TaxID=222984 RepID=L9ZMB7_NATA2|nr:hypothetical protein [Natrinema altunense]ELY86308.1 hypothetical protein C485_09930 [Natrinema altunense JCM 12890]RZH66883.1 hypothetical protein ELS17_13990 [Natrinema altunense]